MDEVERFDRQRVRTGFERAAREYDRVAVLQREVGRRVLERLDVVRLAPKRILDLGAGTGEHTVALYKRYRRPHVIALDLAQGMLQVTRDRAPWLSRFGYVCADMVAIPLADDSVDLVFSNLALQWCDDPDRAFAEIMRVARPGGLLMFSTVGPDTLRELRDSWAAVDDHPHVNPFLDMHDIGDALIRAGFSDPVMDVERLTLTYRKVQTLLKDLKTLGSRTTGRGQRVGLTTAARLQAVAEQYERHRRDGVLPATYEVVYGHAWVPETKRRGRPAQDGLVSVPLDDLRASLRRSGG